MELLQVPSRSKNDWVRNAIQYTRSPVVKIGFEAHTSFGNEVNYGSSTNWKSASGLKRASFFTVPPVELMTGRHGPIRDVRP